MSFEEARHYYLDLQRQLEAGQITQDQFFQQVGTLRLQDASGQWWQIDPGSGLWLIWNGSAWAAGSPPTALAEPAAGPIQCPSCGTQVKRGRKFCPKCGAAISSGVVSQRQPEARPPAAEQCAACGAPLKPGRKFCAVCGATVGAAAAGASDQRWQGAQQPGAQPASAAGGVEGPLGWGARIWNVISLGGCSALSGLWFWYSGMAETEPDYRTCVAIVALPLITILFRKQIDRLLRPLQSVLSGIPRMVRLGVGLAIPFVISNGLYASGSSEFEYLFRTVLMSTVFSYVVLRVPPPLRGAAGAVRRFV